MSEQKKPFTGVSLIVNVQNQGAEKGAEPVMTIPFFAKSADATVMYSAARIDDEAEKSPAKYVAFKSDFGFDIRESNEFAKTKGAEKGALIGKLYAHAYKNSAGADGVMLTGGLNPEGIKKGDKIKEQPFSAIATFSGPDTKPVLAAMVEAGAKAQAKRENLDIVDDQPEPAKAAGPSPF